MKKTVVIVVLGLLVLGLGGYIVYDKVISDDNPKTAENEDNKVEDSKEDLNQVATQLQKIVEESYVFYTIGSKYDEVSYNKTAFENDNKGILQKLIIGYSLENYGGISGNDEGYFITKSNLDNYLKKYYNVEIVNYPDLILESAKELNVFMKYDKKQEKYIQYYDDDNRDAGQGEVSDTHGSYPIFTKIYNIEKNNDEYVLTLTGIYTDGRDCDMYIFDRKCQVELDDSFYVKNNGLSYEEMNKLVISDYEKNYETNKEKYLKSQFTFKKNENGSFYITSFKEVK